MPTLPVWTVPIERKAGWEPRLVDTIERHMSAPFEWGVSDCLIVAADVCAAMTGADPLPARLRKYRTEAAAAKLLLALGFRDAEEALAAVFPEVGVRRARRGDCGVLADAGTCPACFIVLGAQSVGKGLAGPVYVPTAQLKRTFAIGAP